MTQNEALAILKTGANVFLTGEPGSGKTHTINRFVAWLREHGIEPAVTASTGIAATHINGHTIHSWSGIGVRNELTKSNLNRIASNKRVLSRIRAVRTLIIDEISMLSARTLTMTEAVCRAVRGGTDPFGGLQVILVGDFFQLPPIATQNENAGPLPTIFDAHHGEAQPLFAFGSPAWRALDLKVCYLSEQHRQDDPVFLEVLSAIRSGAVSERHKALLGTRLTRQATDGITQFFSHNADVDRVNRTKLSELPGDTRIFSMENRGAKQLVERLMRGCLSPEILTIKTGAKVMFTKNDIGKHRFVNGTLGTLIGFSKEDGCPIVKTNAGRTIFAGPADWSIEEGGQILARITQVPLRLAWAITVHKSQGMSLDAAHMDLSDAFEYGQGYVAISRVRTLAGLSLAGFNEQALLVHPEITAKDAEFRDASHRAQENLLDTPAAELEKWQGDFIRACDGNVVRRLVEEKKESSDDNDVIPVRTSRKERRWERTLTLITGGKNVEEAARARGRKPETIIQHLEELLILKKLTLSDIAHLTKGNEDAIMEIHGTFKNLGALRLKPIYDHFGGRFSYEIIRLARLFFEEYNIRVKNGV